MINEQAIADQVREESRQYGYRTLEYPVEVLVSKLEKQEIVIPEYQRKLVWGEKQKCYFIESVLLQIPVSPMFGAIVSGGIINIVDGSQRIRCLSTFVNNEFKLSSLEALDGLNGLRYHQLPKEVQLTLLTRDVRVILLTDSENLDIQFEIFRRVNSTATTLTDSEIRRGAYQGPFWSFVEDSAQSPIMVRLTPMGARKENRHEREELVLRLFAFADNYLSFVHDVNKFLDAYLQEMNTKFGKHPNLFDEYQKRFLKTMEFIEASLNGALQRNQRNQTPRTRFEAIAVGSMLALESAHEVTVTDLSWVTSDDFEEVTRTEAANSGPRLRARIGFVFNKLTGEDPGKN